MQRIITIIPILVCLAGGWIVLSAVMEHRKETQQAISSTDQPLNAVAPDTETYSVQDRELVQEVFSTPEALDSQQILLRKNTTTHIGSLQLLKSSQFTGSENKKGKSEVREVKGASPLVESFVSLRTDTVRNPDSEQNQTTVKIIMKKRQHRMAKLGMD